MKRLPIVQITFDDHCHMIGGESELITCDVFGVLYKKTKLAYYVCSWVASDGGNQNSDTYTILRGAVKKMRRLGYFTAKN